ncbi:MAG: MarR family winged helix-turn-helix transcriptional regulator [Thermodesulfobacteriota bacterium]
MGLFTLNQFIEKKTMTEDISTRIVTRLRQINRELSKHSKYIQEYHHITVPQLICLQRAGESGPVSIGELTRILHLNNSTVTGIVDRLESRGLVERKRISRDRRQVHVEITEAGNRFLDQAPTPLQQRFLERLNQMEKEKVTTILWSLETLLEMLGAEEKSNPVMTPDDPV